jgi:DNA helicase-2/ATP-dependent DNA helicase PcrA
VSSFLWSPRATPFGPSPFQEVVRDQLADWGEPVPDWRDKPTKGEANPYAGVDPSRPWPPVGVGVEAARRLAAAEAVRAADPDAPDHDLDMVEAARVADWDAELDRLLAEARRHSGDEVEVPLPSSLSATALARLRDDPDEFARELARPMPRPPAPSARAGSRFHAWVEARFGQLPLLGADEVPGRAEEDDVTDADLDELVAAFEEGPFAERAPYAVEAPFALVLDGQVVRGRIDAVYAEPDGGYLIVDWKTSRTLTADPLQLAIYRVAWAELTGVDQVRVRAAFYYVRGAELVEPADLPARAGLEALLTPR